MTQWLHYLKCKCYWQTRHCWTSGSKI